MIIDGIASILMVALVGFAIGLAEAASGVIIDDSVLDLLLNLVYYATYIAYYVVMESSTGQTLGKMITGTRVVGEDDRPISVGKALARTLIRFIPFEPFSFLGSGASGWHDRWTSTQVVLVRGA